MARHPNFLTKATNLASARGHVVDHVAEGDLTMALFVSIAMLWHARHIDVVALLVEYIGNISHITGAAANAVDK